MPKIMRLPKRKTAAVTTLGTKNRHGHIMLSIKRKLLRHDLVVLFAESAREDFFQNEILHLRDCFRNSIRFHRFLSKRSGYAILPLESTRKRLLFGKRYILLRKGFVIAKRSNAW